MVAEHGSNGRRAGVLACRARGGAPGAPWVNLVGVKVDFDWTNGPEEEKQLFLEIFELAAGWEREVVTM